MNVDTCSSIWFFRFFSFVVQGIMTRIGLGYGTIQPDPFFWGMGIGFDRVGEQEAFIAMVLGDYGWGAGILGRHSAKHGIGDIRPTTSEKSAASSKEIVDRYEMVLYIVIR